MRRGASKETVVWKLHSAYEAPGDALDLLQARGIASKEAVTGANG
jgi:hypothetical protein